jgi:hypothetical protein
VLGYLLVPWLKLLRLKVASPNPKETKGMFGTAPALEKQLQSCRYMQFRSGAAPPWIWDLVKCLVDLHIYYHPYDIWDPHGQTNKKKVLFLLMQSMFLARWRWGTGIGRRARAWLPTGRRARRGPPRPHWHSSWPHASPPRELAGAGEHRRGHAWAPAPPPLRI